MVQALFTLNVKATEFVSDNSDWFHVKCEQRHTTEAFEPFTRNTKAILFMLTALFSKLPASQFLEDFSQKVE